jgi:hypothetical protein
VVFVLWIDWSAFHDWLERWASLAEWAVAAGTFALAIATFVLARRARDEAAAVRDEATRVAEQAVASLRAYVYPESTAEWTLGNAPGGYTTGVSSGIGNKVLPLRNGGPGIALNVEGDIRAGTQGETFAIYAGSIAPGQPLVARLARAIEGGWGAWAGTWHGALRYGDLNDDYWTTRFTLTTREGQLVFEHEPPAPSVAQADGEDGEG